MARAKKKVAKKKAAKKKATKKRATKKKVAKKRVTKKRSSALRKVPHTQYELVWDAGRNKCFFGSKSGVSGEVGCGVTDTVTVYMDGVAFYILSLNYAEGYGCVEVLDDEEEPMGICFADASEMRAMFKKDVDKLDPKAACRRLSKECL